MNRLMTFAKKLYRDERGAEGLEKLLIIAAIVLPLLAVLILARNWISDWMTGVAQEVRDDAETDPPVNIN